ncbi:MAG: hypothetical protein CW691_09340 [Candidatus Bathyarchaeum sp.]|nr:MAG: hypothetical protein CW691_09340 [Candidatus Bathyarchaeum sp.]
MKNETNFLLIGLLSLIVGSAFASPLLVTELDPENIKPYLKPPSAAFTSSVTSDVLYANFSVTPNVENDKRFDLSYFVVLNVTNNSDEPANVSGVSFDAQVQDYTLAKDNSGGYSTSASGRTWTAKEAWVDGVHYTVSWVPNNRGAGFEESFDYQGDPELDGEWIEGVKIQEYYINYELAYTKINMNGTWVDVTGRIIVERPAYWPPNEQPMDPVLIWDSRSLMHELSFDEYRYEVAILEIPPRGTPEAFNEIWAPHESRLIAVKDARAVQSKYFELEKLEKLKTEEIVFNTRISTIVTVDNWTDPVLSEDSIQVFVEETDDGYVYSVLPEDTAFTLDDFGVEVFIESRN